MTTKEALDRMSELGRDLGMPLLETLKYYQTLDRSDLDDYDAEAYRLTMNGFHRLLIGGPGRFA